MLYIVKSHVQVKPYHKKKGSYVMGYSQQRSGARNEEISRVLTGEQDMIQARHEALKKEAIERPVMSKEEVKTTHDVDIYRYQKAYKHGEKSISSYYETLKELYGEKVSDSIMRELEVRSWGTAEAPKEAYDFSLTTPETRAAITFINKNSPDSKVKTISTRAFEIRGPDGVAKVYQGVSDGQWRVRYGNDANAERVSDALAGAEEALKWVDNEYSDKEYKRLAGVAKEGETEEEKPQAESSKDAYDLPILSKEEEADLARRYKAGDQEARTKLILHNQKWVSSIVHKTIKRYGNRFYAYLKDLQNVGNEGLMESIETFDPSKGRLVTYSNMPITMKVQREIEKIKARGVEESEWKKVKGKEGEEQLSTFERISHPGPTPEEDLEREQQKELIRKVVKLLPDKERQAIELRFLQELPMNEVEEQMGVSSVTIYKYLEQAMEKLRTKLQEGV